jgi:hypothetical protein
MKKLIIYLIPIVLMSCSNTSQIQKHSTNKPGDSTLIQTYRKLLPNSTKFEKKFITEVIGTFSKFQNKNLDTTILIIGLLDSDNLHDTIVSRVFVNRDTVYVQSEWRKNGNLLWQHIDKNPYMEINDNELFSFDKRSIWVTFTIGYLYTLPRLYSIDDYKNLELEAIKLGVYELNKSNFSTDSVIYKEYLKSFKSNLLEWGNPESRAGLFVWYEPAKRFVTFFRD